MITQYTNVWDTKAEVWGEVAGSYPLEREHNPEAKYFSVGPKIGPHSVDHFRKVNAKDLQPINNVTWVEVRSNETDTHYTQFGALGAYAYINWEKLVKPAPKDYSPPEFAVGELVQLSPTSEYYGIIKSKVETLYRGMYKVVAFSKSSYPQYIESGLPNEETTTLEVESYKFQKLDLPAPRMLMSARERENIRYRFKQNINNGNSNRNYRNVHYKQYRLQHGKVLASAIAAAKKEDADYFNDNVDDVIESFNTLGRGQRDKVWDSLSQFCYSDNDIIARCDDCGSAETPEDMHHSEWHDTRFCESCRDSYVYSEIMNDYISEDDAISYYSSVRSYHRNDPDGYVARGWVQDSNDYHIHDGAAFDEDTYYELTDLEDEEEEEEEDRDGLMGYHNSSRNWVEQWENKSYLPLGLELEVYSEDRREAVMAVRNTFSDMYLERDGSIDDDYGFEVITQPYGKDEWARHGKTLLNLLKDNGAVAYNRPAGKGYGIHININRAYLSPLQEMRMFMFLAANENGDFVKAIAQRANIFNADVPIGRFQKPEQKVYSAGGLTSHFKGYTAAGVSKYNKKINGRGKYAPINLHSGRMEIRIFQSTLNGTSFNKNLEFTWALIEWTSTKAATGYSWSHVDFVKWLAKRPHAEKEYPSLVAFLRKDVYTLIDDDPIENTWKEFIPKETRRSVLQLVVNAFDEEEVEDVSGQIPLALAA